MGVKYLWDTNTVIYYLQQQFPPHAERFMDKVVGESQPCISAITEIELLCWKSATAKDQEILKSFINDSLVLELEQTIKYRTAEVRKKHKIKLPDAIIAATSLVYGLPLITHDRKDFDAIEDLVLIDPFVVD